MDMDMEMEMMYDAMTSSGSNIIPKDIDREDSISLLYLVNKIRHQTGLYRNTSYTLSKCVKSLITYYKTTSSSSSSSTSTSTSTSLKGRKYSSCDGGFIRHTNSVVDEKEPTQGK